MAVRMFLVLLALTLCLAGLAACGDAEQGSSSTSADVQKSEAEAEADAELEEHNAKVIEEQREDNAAAAAKPTGDEQQAKESASDFYAILGEDEAPGSVNKTTIDSVAFCDLMSEEAVAQTVHYAKVSSGIGQKWDCESAIDLLVLRSKRFGSFAQLRRAEVVGVNTEGDRGTASISFGTGSVSTVPLVKEDGEWKLGSTTLGR